MAESHCVLNLLAPTDSVQLWPDELKVVHLLPFLLMDMWALQILAYRVSVPLKQIRVSRLLKRDQPLRAKRLNLYLILCDTLIIGKILRKPFLYADTDRVG